MLGTTLQLSHDQYGNYVVQVGVVRPDPCCPWFGGPQSCSNLTNGLVGRPYAFWPSLQINPARTPPATNRSTW